MSIQAEKLPRFTDISWRWIAYFSSFLVASAIVYAFFQEIELKRDVPFEIVSPSEVKITGLTGLITSVHTNSGQIVEKGQPLFELVRDLNLSSDGTPKPKFDETMRDQQIVAARSQYENRVAAITARIQASERTVAARELELQALAKQQLRTRQIASDAANTLRRLEDLASYERFNWAQERSIALGEIVRLNESSLEATRIGYGTGSRSNLDVLRAQEVLFASRGERAKAQYEMLSAFLALKAEVASLGMADIKMLDNWLTSNDQES